MFQDCLQVFFRSADRSNAVVLDKIVQHIRRNERRERRAKPDVLYAKIRKRQQDTYGFLLIPGKDHGKRQIVYAAAKGFRESDSHTDRAVRIVALAYTPMAFNSRTVSSDVTVFRAKRETDLVMTMSILPALQSARSR